MFRMIKMHSKGFYLSTKEIDSKCDLLKITLFKSSVKHFMSQITFSKTALCSFNTINNLINIIALRFVDLTDLNQINYQKPI